MKKMLIMRCAFSVNSYLALVYDRWPLNIVFHQEFIIVLYFGAKKMLFGGWEEGGSDLSSLGWHCRCHTLKHWVSSSASTTGENGHLPGFILKVSLLSLYLAKSEDELLRQCSLYSCMNCILNQNVLVTTLCSPELTLDLWCWVVFAQLLTAEQKINPTLPSLFCQIESIFI